MVEICVKGRSLSRGLDAVAYVRVGAPELRLFGKEPAVPPQAHPPAPPTPDEPHLSAMVMRRVLIAVRKVVGQAEYAALLQDAGLPQYLEALPPESRAYTIPFSHYAALNRAIHRRYGPQGEGLLTRIGRALFYYAISDQPWLLRAALQGVKLLPPRQRLQVVLRKIGDLTDSLISVPTEYQVEAHASGWAYSWRPCALCWGHTAEHPLGQLFVALFQAAVEWATGLRIQVYEAQCLAQGHAFGRVEVQLEAKDETAP